MSSVALEDTRPEGTVAPFVTGLAVQRTCRVVDPAEQAPLEDVGRVAGKRPGRCRWVMVAEDAGPGQAWSTADLWAGAQNAGAA